MRPFPQGLAWPPIGLALIALLSTSAAAIAQSPRATSQPLRVVATTPIGDVGATVRQASIRFSQPMVAIGGADLERVADVTVTPALPVSFRWADTDVLVVKPRSGRFPNAAAITIRVGTALASTAGHRLESPVSFTFETPAPRLKDVSRGDGTKDGRATVVLTFDRAVRPSDVPTRIRLTLEPGEALAALSPEARAYMSRADADGLRRIDARADALRAAFTRTRPVPFRVDAAASTRTAIALRLVEPQPAGGNLAIAVDGVASPEGPRRRSERDRRVLPTGRPFTIALTPCGGLCDPESLAFDTTRPVTPAALRAALRVVDITDPDHHAVIAPSSQRSSGPAEPQFLLRGLGYRLQPGRLYAVRVDGSLASSDGGPLGAPWVGIVRGGLPVPLVQLSDGATAVWEAANGPRVPLLTRSLLDVVLRRADAGGSDVRAGDRRARCRGDNHGDA
jgi:hypothetical protein